MREQFCISSFTIINPYNMKYLIMFIIAAGMLITFVLGNVYGRIHTPIQEYQIRLELDSAYIYDNGRLVGSCAHGNDGIDSVLLQDNL